MELTLFDQNVAEITPLYSHVVSPKNQHKITSSRDIFDLIQPIWKEIDYRERFAVLLLSRANRVLGLNYIAAGGTHQVSVDIKQIIQMALITNSSALALIHNHPSGSPTPSEADINLTKKVSDAASYFNINILDHLILTSDSYASFRDESIVEF